MRTPSPKKRSTKRARVAQDTYTKVDLGGGMLQLSFPVEGMLLFNIVRCKWVAR